MRPSPGPGRDEARLEMTIGGGGATRALPAGVGSVERPFVFLCAALGMTSVASLLAWVFGLGRFSTWFWAVSVPGMAALVVIGLVAGRIDGWEQVRSVLVLGTIAGLIGTAGYDLFRVPFVFGAGRLLLSPIESYGVLALDATTSSGWTDVTGWAYHFSNGIGFGIVYAALARGRSRWWGVVWAMVLETGTILTPFGSAYNLWWKWDVIAIAYAAHVPFGLAIGIVMERSDKWLGYLKEVSARTTMYALLLVAAGLLIWLRPLGDRPAEDLGRRVAPGPSAVVIDDRFAPVWLRVAPGGCVTLLNTDDASYGIEGVRVEPGTAGAVCFGEEGVHRVHTSGEPFDGGFVIVDGALE